MQRGAELEPESLEEARWRLPLRTLTDRGAPIDLYGAQRWIYATLTGHVTSFAQMRSWAARAPMLPLGLVFGAIDAWTRQAAIYTAPVVLNPERSAEATLIFGRANSAGEAS